MTTLYRPVLIETAEQAEALPGGTVVARTGAGAIEKGTRGRWWAGAVLVPTRTAVGGMAFLPIEAEEETMSRHAWETELGRAVRKISRTPVTTLRRLVTPWEPS